MRGYPENLIDEEMKNVKFWGKSSKKSKGSKGLPIVVANLHSLDCFNHTIKNDLNTLYMIRRDKTLFLSGLMVSFSSTHKMSSYLVKLELY